MKRILFISLLLSGFTVTGQTNYGLSFNGTTQYVTIGSPLSTSSSYTKEAWVYITTAAGSRNILSSNDSPFWINSGILSAGQAGSYTRVTDGSSFPLNRWVYVAVTYDAGTTTMKLYRDGILISTNNAVPGYTNQPNFIGSHAGLGSYLEGNADEIRIWNIALTQAQLKQNMYKGPANDASGLIAFYKCNAGAGTTLVSSCTNTTGLDGTLQNSPAWIASPVQYAGNALKFDGSNDHVIIPHSVSGDFTLEFWMSTTSTGPGGGGSQWYSGSGIIDAEVGGVTNDWGTSLVAGKLAFGVGNPDITLQSSTTVNTGSWFHVAATWNRTTGEMKLYINGNPEGTTTGSTALRTAPSRITLGQIQTNINRFNGSIDELRIWNVVRSQAQIQANMLKELNAVSEVNLVSYYTFNQGIASGTNTGLTIVPDYKGNNNGTLTNFSLTGSTSNFILQNSSLVILPLQWLSFSVQKQGSNAQLNWSTANELNTKDFIIQHSSNRASWSDIGTVSATGNTGAIANYTFAHSNPVNGYNYYRILQADLDGRSSYSETRSLKFDQANASFNILSNPVISGMLKIKVNIPTFISFYSTEGKLLWQRKVNTGTETIDLTQYAKGIYWLTGNGQTEKLVLH